MPNGDASGNKFVELTEIATDVLVKELKRRAVARGLTTEELLAEAQKQWQEDVTEAEDLANKP
jgi:hypothetical protein